MLLVCKHMFNCATRKADCACPSYTAVLYHSLPPCSLASLLYAHRIPSVPKHWCFRVTVKIQEESPQGLSGCMSFLPHYFLFPFLERPCTLSPFLLPSFPPFQPGFSLSSFFPYAWQHLHGKSLAKFSGGQVHLCSDIMSGQIGSVPDESPSIKGHDSGVGLGFFSRPPSPPLS